MKFLTRTYAPIFLFVWFFFQGVRQNQKASLHHSISSSHCYLIMIMFLVFQYAQKYWLHKSSFYSCMLPLPERRITHVWKKITVFSLVAYRQVSQKQHKSIVDHNHLGGYFPSPQQRRKAWVALSYVALQPPHSWEQPFPRSPLRGMHSPWDGCKVGAGATTEQAESDPGLEHYQELKSLTSRCIFTFFYWGTSLRRWFL